MIYLADELYLQIKESIQALILEKEEAEFVELSAIRKILSSSKFRQDEREKKTEYVMKHVKDLLESEKYKGLFKFANEVNPQNLLSNLKNIIGVIQAKKAPENEWLEKQINLIDFNMLSTDVNGNNLSELIHSVELLYAAEITNKSCTKYRNREVRNLYSVATYFEGINGFIDLSDNILSVNEIYKSFDSLENDILRKTNIECEDVSFYGKKNYKIDSNDIVGIIKKEALTYFNKENLIDSINEVVKDKKGEELDERYVYFLRKMFDKENKIEKLLKELPDHLNKNKRGQEIVLGNMNLMNRDKKLVELLRRMYKNFSLVEFESLFKEAIHTGEINKFLLLSNVMNKYTYKSSVLNELSNEELIDFCQKKNKFHIENLYLKEFREYSVIAEKILNSREYDKEIQKFENGENNIDLEEEQSKIISFSFVKLNKLFKDRLVLNKMNANTDKYILSVNEDKCSLVLIGDYVKSLTQEDGIEILIEIIKNVHGMKDGSAEPLIREKELKYKIQNKEIDSNIEEKKDRQSRKKV